MTTRVTRYFCNRTLLLVMREMIQTERDFVRSLQYIIEVTEAGDDVVPLVVTITS